MRCWYAKDDFMYNESPNESECPMGGDIENDCADCIYSCDYHFVNGECVKREEKPKC